MAVALNYRTVLRESGLLARDDDELKLFFRRKIRTKPKSTTYDSLLLDLIWETSGKKGKGEDVNDKYAAEYHFFGSFLFPDAPDPECVQVRQTITQSFFLMSHSGLHWPDYSDADIGYTHSMAKRRFLRSCAVNYLVKNLWHNYVHNQIQGTSLADYKKFGGDARKEADFEADNLSNLFLIYSYGLPVEATGINDLGVQSQITRLLRRNRCNNVFALRARIRATDSPQRSDEEELKELEWRFCRGLSNYLSGWMAAKGWAVTSIGVYLTGKGGKGKRGFFWDGEPVVELNGRRYATNREPLVAAPSKTQRKLFYELAMRVGADYSKEVRQSPHLRAYAFQSLMSHFSRARIPLVEVEEEQMKSLPTASHEDVGDYLQTIDG